MPAVRPVGFTATLNVPGVVPLAGVAVSQVWFVVTVKFRADPVLVTETLCAAGVVPPIW